MRAAIAHALDRIAGWLRPKAMPNALAGQQWTGTQFLDAYKRTRQPSPNEIMAELKNTAWACASINAAICASNPPMLYVATHDGQHSPKCPTKALSPRDEKPTSARGQPQPVETASLASTTRMSVSVWIDSEWTQPIVLDPSTTASCSPKTCAIALGPRPGHSASTTCMRSLIFEASALSGTCITNHRQYLRLPFGLGACRPPGL